MMEQLKPCPFCGNAHILRTLNFGWVHGVACSECGAQISYGTSQEEAEKKWNRRTEVARMEYDREEMHTDCTVHVLWNSETGESSIGWWRNDKPPQVIGGKNNENGV